MILSPKIKHHYQKIFAISLVASLFVSLLFLFNVFFSWREGMIDRLFLSVDPEVPIIIVAIDDESLQAIGRWPWDRKVHAELLEKIGDSKPLLIGYDVNFSEESDRENDEKLAASIKKEGNVLLPVEAKISSLGKKINAKSFLLPIDSLRGVTWGVGTTNTPLDQDGISRRTPLVVYGENGEIFFSFEAMVANHWQKKKGEGVFSLKKIPLDQNGMMRINYTGKPGNFEVVSASKIIGGKVESEKIKDKIVLIGATAPDLHDEYMTPTSNGKPMSGVEIIANKIHTIISESFLVPIAGYFQVVIFFFLSFLVSCFVFRLKIIQSSLLTASLIIGYFMVALIFFDHGIILDLFYSLAVILFTFLLATIFQYLREAKEKKYIKQIFSRYVSAEILEELLNDPSKIRLGGEKRKVTIMFSDIRKFTTISEKLSAENLTKLMNEYLTAMTENIMNSRGVIDKYIGDAVMAFWGAPIKDPKQAELACGSALKMIKALQEENFSWKKRFDVEINIGVGLNTGEVVVGNVGSKKRFDYTLMGDNVNLASRLEGLTKQYGVTILVTEATYKEVRDEFVFRYIDTVAVKGKRKGVKIYELITKKDLCDKKTKILIQKFDKAVEKYCLQEWPLAIKLLKEIQKKYPEDGPTRIYLERCKDFEKKSPGKNWDGVYRSEKK